MPKNGHENTAREERKTAIPEEIVAKTLISKFKVKYHNLEYFKFNELCYEKFLDIDTEIQDTFDKIRENKFNIGTMTSNKVTRRYVSEVKGYIERKCIPSNINYNLIGTKNMVLDIKNNRIIDTKDNQDLFVPIQINCYYSENMECPKIDKFIGEVVGEEYKDTVYEVFGNCLIPRYDSKKIVLFKGPGDSGKSTLLRLLGEILGEWNISPISCYDFKYQFRLYDIVDKLAIISSDVPTGFLGNMNIGMLKILSGNDKVFVEKKNKDGFQYTNRGKIIYSSNYTPSLTKEQLQDDAFLGRWNIIKCEHIFQMGDYDYNELITREEISGLLNKMILGAKRILDNIFKFSKYSTIEENRTEFEKYKLNKLRIDDKWWEIPSDEEIKKANKIAGLES